MDEIARTTAGRMRVPAPIIAIHVLAGVGVVFWLSMIVRALMGEPGDRWGVVTVGIILGGTHVAISWLTHGRSRWVYGAMWFVLVADTALAVFVDPKAVLLVLFTVVLLLLTRVPSARQWFTAPS